MEEEDDILILETGGGRNWIVTIIVWHVFEYKKQKQVPMVYKDKSEGKLYPIVNAVTKVWIQGRNQPV